MHFPSSDETERIFHSANSSAGNHDVDRPPNDPQRHSLTGNAAAAPVEEAVAAVTLGSDA
jgi:hypothetical protein